MGNNRKQQPKLLNSLSILTGSGLLIVHYMWILTGLRGGLMGTSWSVRSYSWVGADPSTNTGCAEDGMTVGLRTWGSADQEIDVTHQWTLSAQKAKCILSCIRRTMNKCQAGDSTLLLHSQETPYGVLCSALGLQMQGLGPVGVSVMEDWKDGQRPGALLWGQPERAEIVQLREEKALGRRLFSFLVPKGPYK